MSTPTSDSSDAPPSEPPSADTRGGGSESIPASNALIIGLGNLLLSDEGVGIHVLRRLEQSYDFSPRIELVDGGTTGLDLLDLFRQHEYILLIDAIFAADSPPGELVVLRDDAILAALSKKMSMHHLGISDVLALSQLLDYRPRAIALIGVVPEHLELGTELSMPVARRLPDILASVRDILGDWQIAMQPVQAALDAPGVSGSALFIGRTGDAH